MTWNSDILIGLNDPFLPVKTCFYRFQPFFLRMGPRSTWFKGLQKIWRNGTRHDNIPFHVCLRFLTDLFCQGTSLPESLVIAVLEKEGSTGDTGGGENG